MLDQISQIVPLRPNSCARSSHRSPCADRWVLCAGHSPSRAPNVSMAIGPCLVSDCSSASLARATTHWRVDPSSLATDTWAQRHSCIVTPSPQQPTPESAARISSWADRHQLALVCPASRFLDYKYPGHRTPPPRVPVAPRPSFHHRRRGGIELSAAAGERNSIHRPPRLEAVPWGCPRL